MEQVPAIILSTAGRAFKTKRIPNIFITGRNQLKFSEIKFYQVN